MKSGIELIAEERQRQIDQLGYTPEYDDQHDKQQLIVAATGLLLNALNATDIGVIDQYYFLDEYCPLGDMDWINCIVEHHRPDGIEGLKIAGSLIAAEIDRIKRGEK